MTYPLSWMTFDRERWHGAAFWRDVDEVLRRRGFAVPRRASFEAVRSAMDDVRQRSESVERPPVDGLAALFGGLQK